MLFSFSFFFFFFFLDVCAQIRFIYTKEFDALALNYVLYSFI